jgi:hypothetical protein
MIDELIGEGAEHTGLSRDQVRLALAGALGLLRKHAAHDRLTELYAAVPGAEALAASPEAQVKSGGGLFGGLMKSAGGVSGAAVADAMGMLDKASKAGIGRADLKALLTLAETRVQARTGQDLLRHALESVPGVGPLLGGKS